MKFLSRDKLVYTIQWGRSYNYDRNSSIYLRHLWFFIRLIGTHVRGFRESFAPDYTITLQSKSTGKLIYERNNRVTFNEIILHSTRLIGLAISSWSSSSSRDFTFTPCIVDSRLAVKLVWIVPLRQFMMEHSLRVS